MALSAIASGAFGLGKTLGVDFGGIFDKVGGLFGGIFGGGSHCTDQDSKTKSELAQAIEKYTTRAERTEFIRSTGSSTSRIKPTGQGMAYFFVGEDDCYHKPGAVSPRHKRFLEELQPWLEQKAVEKQEAQAAQAAGGGGGTSQAGTKTGGISWPVIGVALAVLYVLFNLMKQ